MSEIHPDIGKKFKVARVWFHPAKKYIGLIGTAVRVDPSSFRQALDGIWLDFPDGRRVIFDREELRMCRERR